MVRETQRSEYHNVETNKKLSDGGEAAAGSALPRHVNDSKVLPMCRVRDPAWEDVMAVIIKH